MPILNDWDRQYIYNERRCAGTFVTSKNTRNWLNTCWSYGRNEILKIMVYVKNIKRLLEIGCGSNGIFLIPAAEMKIDAHGIDLSKVALNKLKGRLLYKKFENITLHRGDIQKYGFSNNFFDVVCSSGTICHIKNPYHFLKEINRITRTNGVAYISGFHNKYHLANIPYEVKELFSDFFKKIDTRQHYHSEEFILKILRRLDFRIILFKRIYRFKSNYEEYKLDELKYNKLPLKIPHTFEVYLEKTNNADNIP